MINNYRKKVFICPHCNVSATHIWDNKLLNVLAYNKNNDYESSQCNNCEELILWNKELLVYPLIMPGIEQCSEDCPDNIKCDYVEARNIALLSPRASSVLLRLAIEKLVYQLVSEIEDEKIGNLNHNIGILVRNELPIKIQKMLDSVRVIGNDSIHLHVEINIQEDISIVEKLFWCFNMIILNMITDKRKIEELYKKLPDNKIKGIENRDKKDLK